MTPPPAVWPTLTAHDAPALITWLQEALGFRLTARHEHDGVVQHAELLWPLGGGVMLGAARTDDLVARPGTSSVYVVTDDPDALHARAVAAGAEVVSPPKDTDYGSRDVTFRDPEGGIWSFGTYAGDPG